MSFNVTPRSVVNGDHFKITGRLERRGRSWSAYGHRVVDVLARVPGTSWSLFESVRTNSRGSFTATGVALSGRGVVHFYVLYPGDTITSGHRPGRSASPLTAEPSTVRSSASVGLGGYLARPLGAAGHACASSD